MDMKALHRQFQQVFDAQSKHQGCLKCNGNGEIAVQENGKFKSIPCGCDENKGEYHGRHERFI